MGYRTVKSIVIEPENINKSISNDFDKRLKAIFNEIIQAYDNLDFLEKMVQLYKENNVIFEIAPGFIDWVYRAKLKEAIIYLSRVFEKKFHDSKNKVMDKLMHIAINNKKHLFNKRFINQYKNGGKIIEEEITLENIDDIVNDYKDFINQNKTLIDNFLDVRSNNIAHLTFKENKFKFIFSSMKCFINRFVKILNRISMIYNRETYAIKYPGEDIFFRLLRNINYKN